MQPLNSINVWNSAWNVLAAACFCCLLAGRKKPLNKQNKTKKLNLESKVKCVRLVFIWTETAEKRGWGGGDITLISMKQSSPARSPELSSPFKWLLIKRDFVAMVTSLSRGFTADLSPPCVTIGCQEVDRMANCGGKGGVAAWVDGPRRNHRRETRLLQQSVLRKEPKPRRTTDFFLPGLSEIWHEIRNGMSKDILTGEKGHWLSAGTTA